MNGLVLSGGGARGAYQAGVLKGVGEICRELKIKNPFELISGVSAGAINAVKIAARPGDFNQAAQDLCDLWKDLSSEDIFRTDPGSLGKIGLQWVGKLSFGGLVGVQEGQSLLDTSPLRALLDTHVDFSQIETNIREGRLEALAVSAIDYRNSHTVSFIQGKAHLSPWEKSRKRAEKTIIRLEHIMASSSIPLLFPPQKVDHRFFGDGCVRNQSPSAPAIYMGAKKLLIIGVRTQGMTQDLARAQNDTQAPSVARVINTLLSSILLDTIEGDVERIDRVNQLVHELPEESAQKLKLREIPYLFISPSRDIGEVALELAGQMPRIVRYLIKGLGPIHDAAELISYLLFEKEFCQSLIDMGYQDALAQKSTLTDFFSQNP